MRKFRHILKVAALVAIAGYVAFCAAVYLRQEWFFFRPSEQAARLENAHANGYPAERVDYRSADGTPLYAWYTKPRPEKKIVMFLHGNSYNIEKFYPKILPLAEAGYGTFIPEYRGFGGVKGRITEAGLTADAEAAVACLHGLGYQNRDIFIYGFSMGTHMASYVASQNGEKAPFAGLILEAPFNTLLEVARAHVWIPLPLELIVRDKYDNLALIQKIRTPLLIMAGTDDETIPAGLAEDLFAAAPEPKQLVIYRGGSHSDLYNFRNYRDVLAWLKKYEKN